MKRVRSLLVTAAAVCALLAACSDQTVSSPGGAVDMCASYASCGACTPVPGCGFCFSASSRGGGACTSDPTTCAPSLWTWDPTGCGLLAHPTVADGGASSTDASDASSAPDASDAVTP